MKKKTHIIKIIKKYYTTLVYLTWKLPFSYLNTVVKDLLPDHVALLGSGHDIQESIKQ